MSTNETGVGTWMYLGLEIVSIEKQLGFQWRILRWFGLFIFGVLNGWKSDIQSGFWKGDLKVK